MRSLLDRFLYAGSRQFRDYESTILDALGENLPKAWESVLASQRRQLDLIQRVADNKMVTIFFRKESPTLFPNVDDEFRLAVVTGHGARSFRCTVVVHHGRLSSLEFSMPPKTLSGITIEEVNVEIHPVVVGMTGGDGSSEPADALRVLAASLPLEDIQLAADSPNLFGLGSAIPSDLEALLKKVSGFRVKEWTFLGASPQSVVWEDATYYIFVEGETSGLCLREGESEPTVFRYDEMGDEVTSAGTSFVDALEELVGKQ